MEVYLCMGSIEIMKLSCQELRENDLRHIKIHYSLENRSMEVYIWECQCTLYRMKRKNAIVWYTIFEIMT
jgi:hypothetical protein